MKKETDAVFNSHFSEFSSTGDHLVVMDLHHIAGGNLPETGGRNTTDGSFIEKFKFRVVFSQICTIMKNRQENRVCIANVKILIFLPGQLSRKEIHAFCPATRHFRIIMCTHTAFLKFRFI